MLDELDRVIETMEFEDDGHIYVTGFERDGARATLSFDIHTGVEDDAPQPWHVVCQGVQGFAFSGGTANSVEIRDDDPALWSYSQPNAKLFCSQVAPDRADALLGALYRAHAQISGDGTDAVPFGRGLNAAAAFDGGAGLVAEGPLPLLRAYRSVLEASGVGTSVIGETPPQRWDGRQWVRIPDDIRILVVGDCWVVGESFVAARAR